MNNIDDNEDFMDNLDIEINLVDSEDFCKASFEDIINNTIKNHILQ